MQDFPSNSQKAKAPDAPREKLQPVTSAETRKRKKGLGSKFRQTFFGGSARDAAVNTAQDVVIPEIRDLMHNALMNTLDFVFYGDRTSSRPRRPGGIVSNQNMGHVPYNQISSTPTKASQRTLSRQQRAHHDMSELVIPTRDAAHEVLDQMYEILSQSGDVQVAHLYELTGIRPEFTDQKWGWTSLKGAKAVPLRQGGYLLDLPEPVALG